MGRGLYAMVGLAALCGSGCEYVIPKGLQETSCSQPIDSAPFLWTDEEVFAVGVETVATVCLDADERFYTIESFEVFGDGKVALGDPERDGVCITIPFATTEVSDAQVSVSAQVEQDRIGACETHHYDTDMVVGIRVREPDRVRRFEPRWGDCPASGPYAFLVGSRVGFDYELGVGGEPLAYPGTLPPLLLDTGPLDRGSSPYFEFDMPLEPVWFQITSLLPDDDFSREVTVYDLNQIDALTFAGPTRNSLSGLSTLEVLPSIDGVATCNQPDDLADVVVETPAVCELSDAATTATHELGAPFFVFGKAAGDCVVRADYGTLTATHVIALQ